MISRRQFLGALPLFTLRPGSADERGVLVDTTRCIGCRSCENACRLRAGYEGLPAAAMGFGAGDGKLTFRSKTFVNGHVKRQCMHCLEPACVSVCPVAALEKTTGGPVVYHENLCIGCRYCILACPFDVPKYEWDNALTPRVSKCDFCADRATPACVTACPTGALKFGKRPELLQEARARLGAQPRRYAAIYGDAIVGGTSWIYLLEELPEKMGFPKGLPATGLPRLTWKVIAKLPFVVIGVGLALSAIVRWRGRAKC